MMESGTYNSNNDYTSPIDYRGTKRTKKSRRNQKKECVWFKKLFAGTHVEMLAKPLDTLVLKLPHLPKKVSAFFVKVLPFFVVLFGIVGAVASVLSFFFLVLSLVAWDFQLILSSLGSFLLVFVNAVLLLKAFGLLKKKDVTGWMYIFLVQVMNIVYSIVDMFQGELNVLSGTISLLVFTYLLFEIKSFYVSSDERPYQNRMMY